MTDLTDATAATSATGAAGEGVFGRVVGQTAAVEALRRAVPRPVHAYLLVGPAGTGKRALARAFAAALLCADGGCDTCDVCRRALSGAHPDVVVIEREGAYISMEMARSVVRAAARAPVEADRKVIIVTDLHLVREAGPALLKTIEEPSASTVIIGLADDLPPELVTIASRSAVVDVRPLRADDIAAALVADGVDPRTAADVALAAGGRLDRARLLAGDPSFAERHRAWQEVPDRLDGTGTQVAAVVDDIGGWLDGPVAALKEQQARELEELDQRAKLMGERGSGRREMTDRHKREERRIRTDELLFGLSVLAAAYRDRLRSSPRPAAALAALEAIARANEAIRSNRNPTEALLLHHLLCELSAAS